MDDELPPPPALPPPTPAPPKPPSSGVNLGPVEWVAIVAAAVVFLGALLPWASVTTGFGTVSRSGIDDGGDGLLTLVLGVVGALGVLRPRVGAWVLVVCGILIAGIGLWDLSDIASAELLDVGGGLYLTIIGGVAMFGAGLKMVDNRRERKGDRVVFTAQGPKLEGD